MAVRFSLSQGSDLLRRECVRLQDHKSHRDQDRFLLRGQSHDAIHRRSFNESWMGAHCRYDSVRSSDDDRVLLLSCGVVETVNVALWMTAIVCVIYIALFLIEM